MTRPKACNPTGLCLVYSASEMDDYLDTLSARLAALEQRYREGATHSEANALKWREPCGACLRSEGRTARSMADDLAALRAEMGQ